MEILLRQLISQLTSRVNDLEQQVDEIGDIPSNTSEWRPHPDWWPVKEYVNTSRVPWLETPLENVRYGYVVPDSNNTIKLESGYDYYLSDGSYYYLSGIFDDEGDSIFITHVWDRTRDKDCSDGYKTRAVIICGESRDVWMVFPAYSSSGVDCMYVYFGDCNITQAIFGSSSAEYSNKTIKSIEVSNTTTCDTGAFSNGNAFRNCLSLESIILPEGIKNIGAYAFYNNSALRSITLPESVTSIGAYTFWNCTGMVSAFLPAGLTSIGNAFSNCSVLISVSAPVGFNLSLAISASNNLSVSSMENMIDNGADMTGLTTITWTFGPTNLAKLSADYVLKATNKNITLA